MMEYFLQVVQEFNAKALDEMQRYYPEAWGFTMSYRYNFMLSRMKENMANGILQGYYAKAWMPR